ncbi:hypothetical protein C8A00DRAFT_45210 [Chaetomidium leptoderma]|uniref:Uncharacterized protein n=1 Tax=Chaetomidium leptoderma TaxID=669021 RepID=A0AAN6VHH9_9PEZI|nr:hypothetical protein C8A00DRAFT_45210 [Chaetomidium leptoderma]
MKLKFKVQTASLDKHAPKQKDQSPLASRLTFVNVDRPTQIKSEATQRKIRRHVMKDIGRSRRRGAVRSPGTDQSAITVPRSLPPSIPSYWGDVKVCINFQRLFWAMDMVSEGLLALTMADSAHEFRESLDINLDGTLKQGPQPGQAEPLRQMKQYTESLSLIRVRNRERWTMHMKGLERVVQVSGGVEALDLCPPIRQSLFIVDVLGSLVNDTPPRFQLLPRHSCVLPLAKQPNLYSAQRLLKSTSPLDQTAIVVVDGALRSASQLATLLNHTWDAKRLTLDLLIPGAGSHTIANDTSLCSRGTGPRICPRSAIHRDSHDLGRQSVLCRPSQEPRPATAGAMP